MADFLYVFRGGMDPATPAAEAQAQMKRWFDWMKDLTAKGHLKGGEPLEHAGKVVRGKRKNVSDGPYAEAKDLVGGYLLSSAPNLEAATELAKGCPIFEIETGSVEVRPVMKMEMP